MCNFFSFLVVGKSHRVVAQWGVDSHTDLIALNDLGKLDTPEKSASKTTGFVRCELTPPKVVEYGGFDKWNFVTDQDNLPDWYDPDKALKAGVKWLSEQHHIGPDEEVEILTQANPVWVCWGKVKKMLRGAAIRVMAGSSNVGVMWESSNVGEMRESSNVGVMWESSNVGEMAGSSNVGVMAGSSNVGVMWESSNVGVMWESSNVGEMRESSGCKSDRRTKKVTK